MSSSLILGTAQWGLTYGIANRSGQPAFAEVQGMLEAARAFGVRTLDTARAYGESESVIGVATAGDLGWEIITKLPPVSETADPLVAAEAHLEASRKALGRKRLDGVLLHDPNDRFVADGAVWQLLRSQQSRGEIGTIGISAIQPADAIQALDDSTVEAIQVAASLLDQRLRRLGFFERARQKSRRIFVRSVYLQGVAHLELDELPAYLAPLRDSLRRIRSWASDNTCSATEVFLAYARDLLGGEIVVGSECLAQVTANLDAFRAPSRLPLDELEKAIPALPDNLLNPAYWPKQT